MGFRMSNTAAHQLPTEEQLREQLEKTVAEARKVEQMRLKISFEIEQAAKERLALEQQMQAEFGTTDEAALLNILTERARKNEAGVSEYKALKDQFEKSVMRARSQLDASA